MALSDIEQIKTLLNEKRHILITARTNADGDTIASALALSLWLKHQGKQVDVVISDFVLPRAYQFLRGSREIKSALPPLQKFALTVDVAGVGMEALTYDIKDEKLRIFITPKTGVLSRDRVRTAQSDFLYDLIVAVDTPDLESLGPLYADNTEIFYNIPIIAIDHHPEHERYGQINYLSLTATTTAEILYNIMQATAPEYIDADVATTILTGVIAKTRSFKNEATKPALLTLASKLIELGANRDAIVTELFRTRTVATLKLWGEALRHLEHDRHLGLVWSTITREDFARTGASETDLKDIIDELIVNSPDANIVALFHEHPKTAHIIHVIVKSVNGRPVKKQLAPYHPQGEQSLVSFAVTGKTLAEVTSEITNQLRAKLVQS